MLTFTRRGGNLPPACFGHLNRRSKYRPVEAATQPIVCCAADPPVKLCGDLKTKYLHERSRHLTEKPHGSPHGSIMFWSAPRVRKREAHSSCPCLQLCKPRIPEQE